MDNQFDALIQMLVKRAEIVLASSTQNKAMIPISLIIFSYHLKQNNESKSSSVLQNLPNRAKRCAFLQIMYDLEVRIFHTIKTTLHS